ncbi:MspA family porin [Nocardia sp. R7R-8]|uniref:MspA family porin n=1 Tax=Nocardia sp. R7R-8 TaxID=3459304 RepID=UPI00403DA96F
MINHKGLARLAGMGAAATVAMGLFSTGAANADTFVPLPGAEIVKTLSDGTVITVRLADESATISPSMGATPIHRNAWVSASAQVEVSGTGAAGSIWPGYTVGCQVNIAGGGVNGGAAGTVTSDGNGGATGDVGGNGGANLSLGPGQAKSFYVLDLEKPDGYGNEYHYAYNSFQGTSASVTWADESIGLSGCAGYAQARAFVSVEIFTDTVTSWVTLWGQPFSIG